MEKNSLKLIIATLFLLAITTSVLFASEVKTVNPGQYGAPTIKALELAIDCEKTENLNAFWRMKDARLVFLLIDGAQVIIVDRNSAKGLIKIRRVDEPGALWTVKTAIK